MSDQAAPSVDKAVCRERSLSARRVLRFGIGLVALLFLVAFSLSTFNFPETTRAVEPRLSAGQTYAACRPDDPDLLIARLRCPGSLANRLAERRKNHRPVVRGPEPDLDPVEQPITVPRDERETALRDLGSTPGGVSQAAKVLRRVGEQAPKDARSQSDAAAALYVQAQSKQDPLPLLDAYAFAERATKLDPMLPEARFNRALVEESLGLREQARASWARYLALDPESGWSTEAQSHLDRLAPTESEEAVWKSDLPELERAVGGHEEEAISTIVDRHRQRVREEIFERILPEWGKAVLAGDAEKAASLLAFAGATGQALARLGGDRSAERATGAIQGQSVRSQAQAFVMLGEAARLVGERDFLGAQSLLEREGKIPFTNESVEKEVAFLHQRIAYSADRFGEQRAIGHRLLDQTSDGRSPHLRGRVHWSLGTMELLLGRPAEGIESYRAAEAEFERCGETKNLAAVRGLLAGALADVGDIEGAWTLRLGSLHDLRSTGDPPRLRLAASDAAFAAVDLGRLEVARAFLAESLLAARVDGRPMPIARVLLHIAELAGRRGDPDEGLRAIAGARRIASQIASDSDRKSLEVDLFMNEGRLLVARNPMAASTRLTEAIDRYDALAYSSFRPLALAARAEAHLAAGDDQSAERDLAESLDLLERTQATVPDAGYAIGFLDRVLAVYDRMIALQIDLRHRPDRALEVAERGRARRLRDQLASVPGSSQFGRRTPPIKAEALQAALRPGVTALVYKDLPDRLLIWRVERDHLDLVQVPITRNDLETQVEQARLSAKQDAPDSLDRLASLYDQLIRPIEVDGEAEIDLLLVTSGALSGVPFAALWDRSSRRFLVERATIRFAPSLSLQSSIPRLGVSGSLDNLLVVADPSSRSFPGALPGARDEARAIIKAFPGAEVVDRAEATPQEVLRRLPDVSILHFAAHAVADSRSPFLSYLVLASSDSVGSSGYLYAKDLFGPRLPNLRLVVLSACNTAGKYTSASEGIVGLAWPFLARGASEVIASNWEADDRASAGFFAQFYEELAGGLEPAAALRASQRRSIQGASANKVGGQGISDWGAFAVFGR